MYLKKLSIHGFKSFVSPTDLEFDSGITAIVGPNGCGKSNIVDALRWVIGEQRARVLRSDKMDSVIFNGTSRRRAVGLAEVQLTISNTRGVLPLEYSEVTLGRRLYRSGEAEYLLNGVECRLRDITDLFTDTGMGAGAYSVIELKMVDEILSDNTTDRRRLFEEASGITRYKKRRTDALRKLDSMQSDLARVQDLTDEIATRVRSLKRQAQIAERYLRYRAELRSGNITLLKCEYDRLLAQEEVLIEQESELADKCSALNAEIYAEEAQIESLRTNFIEEEKRAQVNRQALVNHQQRIIKLEGDIRLELANQKALQENMSRLVDDQNSLKKESEILRIQRTSMEADLSEAASESNKMTHHLKDALEKRDDARKVLHSSEAELDRITSEARYLREQKVDHQRYTDRLQSRIIHLEEEKIRLEKQLESEEKAHQEALVIADHAKVKLESAGEDLKSLRAEHDRAAASHQEIKKQMSQTEDDLQSTQRDLAEKDGEVKILEDLVKTYDFFPNAVRYLLTDTDDLEVLSVGDLVECDPQYRAALAASLEPYGSSIVVHSEAEATSAVHRLRTDDKGRAHFIVLENLPNTSHSVEYPANALLSVIRIRDEMYQPAIHILLQDVVLVDSLDDALRLQKEVVVRTSRYVTLDGEWVDQRGVLYAGGSEEGGTYSHLARRESLQSAMGVRAEIQEQVEIYTDMLHALRISLKQIDLSAIEGQLRHMEHVYREADRMSEKQNHLCEIGASQLEATQLRLQKISEEIDHVRISAQPQDEQLSKIDQQLATVQTQLQSQEKEIHSLRTELDQLQASYIDAHAASVQATAYHERLEGNLVQINERQSRIGERIERFHREQTLLEHKKTQSSIKLTELNDQIAEEKTQHQTLGDLEKQDRSKEHQLRIGLESAHEKLRKLQRSLQAEKEQETSNQVKYSAVKVRLEDLHDRAIEDYSVDLKTMPETTDIDDASLKVQIQETERKIQSMGNVNALALDEYNSQSDRLQFLMEQREDLEEAEETLIRTIKEINRTASRQFMDTYLLIQENFQDLFKELFGERAKCELGLMDPDDVLESPITVTARPSGKRPVSIAQLSSGEKTLTAIALLFAIYLIKPSPFCFLDEVDAPLDDINIDHFMRVIHRFSSETQFILITHNKRTMEMANRLYGVTMQEEGVSSLVSVKFDEAVDLGR